MLLRTQSLHIAWQYNTENPFFRGNLSCRTQFVFPSEVRVALKHAVICQQGFPLCRSLNVPVRETALGHLPFRVCTAACLHRIAITLPAPYLHSAFLTQASSLSSSSRFSTVFAPWHVVVSPAVTLCCCMPGHGGTVFASVRSSAVHLNHLSGNGFRMAQAPGRTVGLELT